MSLPLDRILQRLDSYLERNDYAGAERHLQYWLSEADASRDERGRLSLLNEQIGLYRKTAREAECLAAIAGARSLSRTLGLENSLTYGTTLINAATGCKAFGRAAEALPLYREARALYESSLPPDDARLGGLYNNMALTLAELGEFREAEDLYRRAIGVMEKQEHGALEVAVTRLNMADLIAAETGLEDGAEEIEKQLAEAERLLDSGELPRDGHYAFVCEKCAPVFGYYGYFVFEEELTRRAKEIHERT